MYCNVSSKYRKCKKTKYCIFKKVLSLFIVYMIMNMKKYLKKKNQLKYQKVVV